MTETNEFDDLELDETTEQTFSNGSTEQESDQVVAGNAGQKYNWQNAPEGIKAPARVDLNGKTVTIKKADIIIPPKSREFSTTRAGDKEFKYCQFILFYDEERQQEFYSGVRVFKRDDGVSHPTFTRDRNNQASKLLGLYADFKDKDIAEVSLREFMGFLNSQPKVKIVTEDVLNPKSKETIKKNFVGEFVQ